MGGTSAHGMGNLYQGIIDAHVYIGILERHMLLSRWCLFPEVVSSFEQDNFRPHLYELQQHSSIDRVCVCVCSWLTCLRSWPISDWIGDFLQHDGRIRQWRLQTVARLQSCAIMDTDSSWKTPIFSILSSQTIKMRSEKERWYNTMVILPHPAFLSVLHQWLNLFQCS